MRIDSIDFTDVKLLLMIILHLDATVDMPPFHEFLQLASLELVELIVLFIVQ